MPIKTKALLKILIGNEAPSGNASFRALMRRVTGALEDPVVK